MSTDDLTSFTDDPFTLPSLTPSHSNHDLPHPSTFEFNEKLNENETEMINDQQMIIRHMQKHEENYFAHKDEFQYKEEEMRSIHSQEKLGIEKTPLRKTKQSNTARKKTPRIINGPTRPTTAPSVRPSTASSSRRPTKPLLLTSTSASHMKPLSLTTSDPIAEDESVEENQFAQTIHDRISHYKSISSQQQAAMQKTLYKSMKNVENYLVAKVAEANAIASKYNLNRFYKALKITLDPTPAPTLSSNVAPIPASSPTSHFLIRVYQTEPRQVLRDVQMEQFSRELQHLHQRRDAIERRHTHLLSEQQKQHITFESDATAIACHANLKTLLLETLQLTEILTQQYERIAAKGIKPMHNAEQEPVKAPVKQPPHTSRPHSAISTPRHNIPSSPKEFRIKTKRLKEPLPSFSKT